LPLKIIFYEKISWKLFFELFIHKQKSLFEGKINLGGK
jgi:hypothetical protein